MPVSWKGKEAHVSLDRAGHRAERGRELELELWDWGAESSYGARTRPVSILPVPVPPSSPFTSLRLAFALKTYPKVLKRYQNGTALLLDDRRAEIGELITRPTFSGSRNRSPQPLR